MTLFKVKLLESTFGNDKGEILKIVMVDEEGNIYYYDGFDRWCYLLKTEEGTVWERV